jgi:hypothetical protein
MDAVYALPGAAALVEWLLACVLYTLGWSRMRRRFNRVGDSLALAGLATALASLAWLGWELSPRLASRPAGLALTLSLYIQMAGQMLTGSGDPSLGALSGGVFPYENLALAGLALGALALGLRAAFPVSKTRALAASALGLGVGLGVSEAVVSILALILAPTGLL